MKHASHYGTWNQLLRNILKEVKNSWEKIPSKILQLLECISVPSMHCCQPTFPFLLWLGGGFTSLVSYRIVMSTCPIKMRTNYLKSLLLHCFSGSYMVLGLSLMLSKTWKLHTMSPPLLQSSNPRLYFLCNV